MDNDDSKYQYSEDYRVDWGRGVSPKERIPFEELDDQYDVHQDRVPTKQSSYQVIGLFKALVDLAKIEAEQYHGTKQYKIDEVQHDRKGCWKSISVDDSQQIVVLELLWVSNFEQIHEGRYYCLINEGV